MDVNVVRDVWVVSSIAGIPIWAGWTEEDADNIIKILDAETEKLFKGMTPIQWGHIKKSVPLSSLRFLVYEENKEVTVGNS